jgi:uncharacterized RDD family membrane protein YckC
MPSSASHYAHQNPWRQTQLEGVKLASFRRRLGAFLVDGLLAGALILLLSRLLAGAAFRTGGGQLSLDFGGLQGVVGVVAYFGLATYFGKGATPGKRLFGIRVVSLFHERISLWHSIERALGYSASALEAGFGFLQYFTHPNRQTVHDRIAETLVIDTRVTKAGQ